MYIFPRYERDMGGALMSLWCNKQVLRVYFSGTGLWGLD